jgi:hypothetical protein
MSGIDRRKFLSHSAAMGLALKWGSAFAFEDSQLTTAHHPRRNDWTKTSREARPWVYWYWMNGLVTREGIAADLQAMHDAGIGGVYLMTIGKDSPLMSSPVTPASPVFWSMIGFAASEVSRLGMDLAMSACDGWATAGGPWIDPAHAMQKVVWSRTVVDGGRSVDLTLPMPPLYRGSYQDAQNKPLPAEHQLYRELTVVALPSTPEAERTSATEHVLIRSNISNFSASQLQQLLAFAPGSPVLRTRTPGYIEIEFASSFTCRSLRLRALEFPYQASRMELLVSADGHAFRSLGRLVLPEHGWDDRRDIPTTHAIPPTSGRVFRLLYDPAGSEHAVENFQERYDKSTLEWMLSGLLLSSTAAVHQFEGKAGYVWRGSDWTTPQQLPADLCVPLLDTVDLTPHTDADGHLHWDAPAGRWTILRIGYAPTGAVNETGGGATGLECDKFNPAAVTTQLKGWLGPAMKNALPGLRSASSSNSSFTVHIDSWEAGCQNWSPVFRDEFQRRRGYDPIPFLPAMTGVPLESLEASECFLWDVRQTVSELVADTMYAATQSFSRDHGALFSAEAIAPVMLADGMLHQEHVDIPMGEFWWNSTHNDKPTDCLEAISASHLHGKPVAQMESFTTVSTTWDEHPFLLKALGDHNFCLGANRFVLHVFTLQTWPDRFPGVTLGPVGQFFTGHQLWWKPGRAWIAYLTRCQNLLQQGNFAVDLLYFIGDDSPRRALLPEHVQPSPPQGYRYDSIDPETLLRSVSVKDHRLILPNGNGYALLVLPPSQHMTIATLTKLSELLNAGATVVGPPPSISPSLTGGTQAAHSFRRIVAGLWGNCDGTRVTEHRVGKGKIVWGRALQDLLKEHSVSPDFLFSDAQCIEFTHRQSPAEDLYFVSNQSLQPQTPICSFRIFGSAPEILLPETGETLHPAAYRQAGGRTEMTLQLGPYESIFLRFPRNTPAGDIVRSIRRDGHALPALANPSMDRTGCLLGSSRQLQLCAIEGGLYDVDCLSGHRYTKRVDALPPPFALVNEWELNFQSGRGAPSTIILADLIDWTKHADPRIRHFSGTATYRTHFRLPEGWLAEGRTIFLDLGVVGMLAELSLNGQALGVLWKPPFLIGITSSLRPENTLEIEVSNVWKNRLIGDAALPPAERITWFADENVRKHPGLQANSQLASSGLLGPVVLRALSIVELDPA